MLRGFSESSRSLGRWPRVLDVLQQVPKVGVQTLGFLKQLRVVNPFVVKSPIAVDDADIRDESRDDVGQGGDMTLQGINALREARPVVAHVVAHGDDLLTYWQQKAEEMRDPKRFGGRPK